MRPFVVINLVFHWEEKSQGTRISLGLLTHNKDKKDSLNGDQIRHFQSLQQG
jgi:hypothetical protein